MGNLCVLHTQELLRSVKYNRQQWHALTNEGKYKMSVIDTNTNKSGNSVLLKNLMVSVPNSINGPTTRVAKSPQQTISSTKTSQACTIL